MRTLFAMIAALFALSFSVSTPAHAQASRTWVSGVGDDANPCSRTAPCKTFAGAISKTAPGGEISVLDPGGFGAVTITKSITIASEGGSGEGGILSPGVNGITINAGANDVVTIRGLAIHGGGSPSPGLNGVRFIAGRALHIQNCIINTFLAAAPNGNGVLFAPTGSSQLNVSGSTIINNGTGILVKPTGAGSPRVSINGSQVNGNTSGIKIDAGNSSLVVRDSMVAGNGTGLSVVVPAGSPGSQMTTDSVNVFNNGVAIQANGAPTVILVSGSTIVANGTALSTLNGGSVLSSRTNNLAFNVTPGAFTPPVQTQQ